jgi:hypothetical protein
MKPPTAVAILRWIPAFAGMTRRIRHLAKMLRIYKKAFVRMVNFSQCRELFSDVSEFMEK